MTISETGPRQIHNFQNSRSQITKDADFPSFFAKTLVKGPFITSWIFNLHANAHDFDIHKYNS